MLLTASLAMAGTAQAAPVTWIAVLGKSQIVVHVQKKGVLSGMAHDHHFVAGDWRATARFDPADPASGRFEVIVAAGSLRDRQPELSPKDRDKVNRQAAGDGVLDAQRHPEIRFLSTGSIQVAAAAASGGKIDGELHGTLSLRGRERPLTVEVHAVREGELWRARGSTGFKQSDFGIEPYSGFLGTIAVHDEVKVEYDLVMTPAR
jgi:polyisoprenoid-binding protein YceI